MTTALDALACTAALIILITAVAATVRAFTRKVSTVATWDELDDAELAKAFAMLPETPALRKAYDERFGPAPITYDGPPLLRIIVGKFANRRQGHQWGSPK